MPVAVSKLAVWKIAVSVLLLTGVIPTPPSLAQAPSPSDEEAAPSSMEFEEELSSSKEASIAIGGERVDYTATVADYITRHDDGEQAGQPKARFTSVSYVRTNGGEAVDRPVTFAFNGGPLSASVWVHLGLYGPKRSQLDDQGFPNTPPPGRLVDNPYSVLDVTDLVFVDPVSSGFSRPAPGEDESQFYGFTNDVETIAEFINLWVTRHGRWGSPKFLAGESYGTTRAAGLAAELQDGHGMYLNGIALVSSVLDWQTKVFNIGNDLPHVLILPTMTASAWYHGRLPEKYEDLSDALRAAEEFALGDYSSALMQGDRIGLQDEEALTQRLSELTGLSPTYIRETNHRPEIMRFTKELLRSERKTVGRLDSRYTGADLDSAGETFEYDPAGALTSGWYVSLINDYLRRDLGYPREIKFRPSAGGRVRPWNYHENSRRQGYNTNGYANYAETLRQTMIKNPNLHVLVQSGYYDLATPYFASDYTVTHMQLPPALRNNIQVAYYEAGHMFYLREQDLVKSRADFIALLDRALKQ